MEKPKKELTGWKKYFRGWNLPINFAIAFVPAVMATVILLEIGVPEAAASAIPIISFVFLVGIIREGLGKKIKGHSGNKPVNTERLKEWLKKYCWIVTILLVLIGLFYWYQLRPSLAYRECNEFALDAMGSTFNESQYDIAYEVCLRKRGID